MHGKKYDDAKKEIRSVLLTYKDSVTLDEFLRTYRGLLGQRLPSRDLGFSTDVAFLQSMPDVVDVKTDSSGKFYLNGIADKSSQHIQKLVSRQKKTKPNNNKNSTFNARQPIYKLPRTALSTRESKPFLPGALRAEFLELMRAYNNGVTLSAFALSYRQRYKKILNLSQGLKTLEAMINLIPELEVRNENNEKTVHNTRCLKSDGNERNKNAVLEKNSSVIHESGVPDDILKNFKMILKKFPDGIQNIHFHPLYVHVTKKELDLVDLGYCSMADLVDALPDIFKRVSNPGDEQHWLIYPAKAIVVQNPTAKQIASVTPPAQHIHEHQSIPADVSSPTLQYIELKMPDSILNKFVPVFVSAIANPALFWFQLQTDELKNKSEELENDIQNFYSNTSYEYRMNNVDIAIGATCVVQCPSDCQWYRGIIKSIPSIDSINVSYVDYGSRNTVPRKNVYYVWSKFHDYPTYAFKAQLAYLKPTNNADSWSKEAWQRFHHICANKTLMAHVEHIDKETYTVSLCDTSGDEDVYVHDLLINEGYAALCDQSHFNIGNDTSSNSESDLSINQDILQSDSSGILSETNELPVNRNLSFSTDVLNNDVQLNAFHVSEDKPSKRYVKAVEICEGSKIHLISLESKLYMSCSELCNLLWSGKNAHFLIRKLMHKEIDIPFLHFNKEDHVELVKQCLRYKVPGFENNDSDNSSIILCPVEGAFEVLNIFGHPSVCLRVIMQHEIRIYDPCDEIWNDFFCDESLDLNDIEEAFLEEINKLCLYDLKTKSEAFIIQKLKLQRLHSNPHSEEIRKIETKINVIARRMKQIEEMCSKYSSCS